MKLKRRKHCFIINIADMDQEKTKQSIYVCMEIFITRLLTQSPNKSPSKGPEEGMHMSHIGDTPSCWDFTVLHQL